MKVVKQEISNTIVTFYFDKKTIDLEKIKKILDEQKIVYHINYIANGKVKLIEFEYDDILIRIFESGKAVIIIKRPKTIEQLNNLIQKSVEFLQKLTREYESK